MSFFVSFSPEMIDITFETLSPLRSGKAPLLSFSGIWQFIHLWKVACHCGEMRLAFKTVLVDLWTGFRYMTLTHSLRNLWTPIEFSTGPTRFRGRSRRFYCFIPRFSSKDLVNRRLMPLSVIFYVGPLTAGELGITKGQYYQVDKEMTNSKWCPNRALLIITDSRPTRQASLAGNALSKFVIDILWALSVKIIGGGGRFLLFQSPF